MADADQHLVPRRLLALRMAALAIMVLLAGRLWHVQFVRGEELRKRAAANRFVAREIEADRGVLYDSSGRQVVMNRPRFTVSMVTAALPSDDASREQVFDRLEQILGIGGTAPAGDSAGGEPLAAPAASSGRGLPELLPHDEEGRLILSWEAVPIARNVARLEAFELMEAAADLPGVIIGESPVREYPAGPSLAHILGFTGSIPSEELDRYTSKGYKIYDIVGRSGLEATFEDALRGEKGRKWVEIDATGREIRTVGEPEPPSPGRNLHLTVDLRFQQATEEALVRGLNRIGARTGAVVALDPRDSAVRALVTWPTYDNNMFATGATPDEFAALLDNKNLPLVNRAITGQYPPGSVFKIVTASAALQEGVIGPNTRIFDPGTIYLPNEYDPSIKYPFNCWLSGGHGYLNIVGAIAHSCDVFFYEVSGGYFENGSNQEGLGSDRLARYARDFGLGSPTGLELLGEAAGRVPTKKWLAEWSGLYWGTGQTYIMGIGQGYTLVTPLQLANLTAAVANGGALHRPHLVASVSGTDGGDFAETTEVLGRLPVAAEYLTLVRQGMRGAVDFGTANRAWTNLPSEISIGGKTGTAEFCDWVPPEEPEAPPEAEGTPEEGEGAEGNAQDEEAKGYCRYTREGHLLTHAWFVAFAPAEDPEIALAVFVDGSGLDRVIEGSREAAPIAAEVLRAWFDLPPATATPPPTATAEAADPMGE